MKNKPAPTKEEIIAYFQDALGPHLDPTVYERSYDDLLDSYLKAIEEEIS